MLKQLNEFQKQSRSTAANYSPLDAISIYGLGTWDEGGEVGGLYKKFIGHNHPIELNEVKKEVGDCLWYASRVCDFLEVELGITWGQVATITTKQVKTHSESQFTILQHLTLDLLGFMSVGSSTILWQARELNQATANQITATNKLDKDAWRDLVISYKGNIHTALESLICGVKSLTKLYKIDVLEVLEINQQKLKTRFENGFSTQASMERVDTKEGGADLVDSYEGKIKKDELCPQCKTHKLHSAKVKNKIYVVCGGHDCSYVKKTDTCPECNNPMTSGESHVFNKCFECACKPKPANDNSIFDQILNIALNSHMTTSQYKQLEDLIFSKVELNKQGSDYCEGCDIAFLDGELTYTDHENGGGWYCKECLKGFDNE